MASVTVIIVNYRSTQLAIDCLRSLETIRHEANPLRVMLVENCSPDDSWEQLNRAIVELGCSEWVQLIQADRNGGFAYGNNVALRLILAESTKPDYCWLLNPDTLVRPGALSGLIEYLQNHEECGIVGSRLEWPNGELPTSVFRFFSIPSELDRGLAFGPVTRLLDRYRLVPTQPTQDSHADWVPGASMLIRTAVFEQIGLLDESYFMYYEETDFCLRARRAGIRCGFASKSQVVHLEGQSSGIRQEKEQRARRLPKYWFDSRQRYFRKNYGRLYSLGVDAIWSFGYVLRRIKNLLTGKPNLDPPYLLSDTLKSTFRSLPK